MHTQRNGCCVVDGSVMHDILSLASYERMPALVTGSLNTVLCLWCYANGLEAGPAKSQCITSAEMGKSVGSAGPRACSCPVSR